MFYDTVVLESDQHPVSGTLSRSDYSWDIKKTEIELSLNGVCKVEKIVSPKGLSNV